MKITNLSCILGAIVQCYADRGMAIELDGCQTEAFSLTDEEEQLFKDGGYPSMIFTSSLGKLPIAIGNVNGRFFLAVGAGAKQTLDKYKAKG